MYLNNTHTLKGKKSFEHWEQFPGRTDVQDMQDLCKSLAQILHAKLARFADSTARSCKILAEILLHARKMSVFLHVSCKFLQESCNPLLQDFSDMQETLHC